VIIVQPLGSLRLAWSDAALQDEPYTCGRATGQTSLVSAASRVVAADRQYCQVSGLIITRRVCRPRKGSRDGPVP
jgi:hypothetical protein